MHFLAGKLALAAWLRGSQVEALAEAIDYQPAVAVAAFRGHERTARELIKHRNQKLSRQRGRPGVGT